MHYKNLGSSNIRVSTFCLGSMTWGTQNTEKEGHEQIDYALDQGVNFIDTAEMYPVNPISVETTGRTEEIIGNWIAKNTRRSEIVLATKVAGAGSKARDGEDISPTAIQRALEGSLKRLNTDYIDLYQLHWPNRGSYHFRQNWKYDPTKQNRHVTQQHIYDVLQELDKHIKSGKIRTIGLSNESSWGTSEFLRIAKAENFPQVVSIQNEYSLLDRKFDLDLGELCHNENVGLLAFSPLAAGMLSGKYSNGEIPIGSRRSHVDNLGGRWTDSAFPALNAYLQAAKDFDLDSCQMALAFCYTRYFMNSVISSATSLAQLQNSIKSVDIKLTPEIQERIQEIYRQYPMPF